MEADSCVGEKALADRPSEGDACEVVPAGVVRLSRRRRLEVQGKKGGRQVSLIDNKGKERKESGGATGS